MKSRNNSKSFFEHVAVVPVLVIILGVVILGVIRMYNKNKKTDIAKEEIQQEMVELQEKKNRLEYRLDELSTDRGIEAELRDQYHVVHEGEEQIVIIENEPEMVDTDDKGWLSELFH